MPKLFSGYDITYTTKIHSEKEKPKEEGEYAERKVVICFLWKEGV